MRDDSPTLRRVTRRTRERHSPHRKRFLPPKWAKRHSLPRPSGIQLSSRRWSGDKRLGQSRRAIARQYSRSSRALSFICFVAFIASRLSCRGPMLSTRSQNPTIHPWLQIGRNLAPSPCDQSRSRHCRFIGAPYPAFHLSGCYKPIKTNPRKTWAKLLSLRPSFGYQHHNGWLSPILAEGCCRVAACRWPRQLCRADACRWPDCSDERSGDSQSGSGRRAGFLSNGPGAPARGGDVCVRRNAKRVRLGRDRWDSGKLHEQRRASGRGPFG